MTIAPTSCGGLGGASLDLNALLGAETCAHRYSGQAGLRTGLYVADPIMWQYLPRDSAVEREAPYSKYSGCPSAEVSEGGDDAECGRDDQVPLTRVVVRRWEMDGLCVEEVCLPQSQRYARRAGVHRNST